MKSCLVFLAVVVLIVEAAPPQLFYISNPPQPQQSAVSNNSTGKAGTTVENEMQSSQTVMDEGLQNQQQHIELSDDVEIDDRDLKQEDVYYIYHPSGVLQRIVYLAKDDPVNMAYTAQFKYENVEPIREPIYTYDPNTLVYQRLII